MAKRPFPRARIVWTVAFFCLAGIPWAMAKPTARGRKAKKHHAARPTKATAAAEKPSSAGAAFDGIPPCPDCVNNPKNGADALMGPALKQATTWHRPTPAESASMVGLIKALKNGDSARILSYADSLKLQVCRNRTADDSYLILYTKPGVTDYSGPFIMFRERNATPIIIQAPHNWNGDHTEGATQLAFQKTRCLAYMSNGHRRTLSGDQSPKRPRYESDFAHSSSCLAWVAFKSFQTEFPNSIFIQFHGMSGKGMLICDAAKSVRGADSLFDAFLAGAKYAARNKRPQYRNAIREWKSNVFKCGTALTRDPAHPKGKRKKNNNRWIGIEMGITTSYLRGSQVVPDIIKYLENGYLRDKPLQKSP